MKISIPQTLLNPLHDAFKNGENQHIQVNTLKPTQKLLLIHDQQQNNQKIQIINHDHSNNIYIIEQPIQMVDLKSIMSKHVEDVNKYKNQIQALQNKVPTNNLSQEQLLNQIKTLEEQYMQMQINSQNEVGIWKNKVLEITEKIYQTLQKYELKEQELCHAQSSLKMQKIMLNQPT